MSTCRPWCPKKTIVQDDQTGDYVCSSCGVTQTNLGNFHHSFGGINGPEGTFVRLNSSSDGSVSYKEYKLYHSTQTIEHITSLFNFSPAKTVDVKRMIEQITDGEFGDGNWFTVLIGACCYVVMRNNKMPVSMSEIAGTIGYEVHELGRMVVRVIEFLRLNVSEFDIVYILERAVRNYSGFGKIEGGRIEKMASQGRFLLQCGVKWYLTTGRQPVPVVVAVLVFVAELNEIAVSIEDVARELHVGVGTSKKRYKEVKEALVKVAQVLPWGKNVTVKNIVKNAPFVIKYMEMRSRGKAREEKKGGEFVVGIDVEELVSDCLTREEEYGSYDCDDKESDLRYFERGNGNGVLSVGDLRISHDCLATIYAELTNENALALFESVNDTGTREGGEGPRRKRKKRDGLRVSKEWWTGDSDMSKKISFKQILEKDVGFNPLPPSFVAGQEACKRRKEKIKVAKLRIDEIMQPQNTGSGEKENGNNTGSSDSGVDAVPKLKGGDMDWEDRIIETLLLHQVNEKEIEQGHYNRLLDLYVFDSENTCKIFGRKK